MIVGTFLKVALGATAIGIATALAFSVVLRHGKLDQDSTHIEVALTIGAGYLAYALAEWLGLSGVLSLFFCSVTLGHYNWYAAPTAHAAILARCLFPRAV